MFRTIFLSLKQIVLIFFISHLYTIFAQKIVSTNFELKNGLLNPSITQIYQTKNHDIWLSSFGGVTKFNGESFKHFTSNDGLKSELIRSVCETSNGKIYIASMEDGLFVLNNHKFKLVSKQITKELFFLLSDNKNGLYLASNKGLIYFNKKGTFKNISKANQLAQSYVTHISQDKKGNIWFNYDQVYGVYSYNPKTRATKQFNLNSNDSNIRIIGTYHDKLGNVWLTSSEGLFKLKNETFTKVENSRLPNYYLFDFTDIGNNMAVIGSQQDGLILYNYALNKVIKKFDNNNGLLNSLVFRILKDKENNIWTSCWGKGISRVQLNGLSHYENGDFKDVYHLTKYKNKLYIATNNGIFEKTDNSFKKLYKNNMSVSCMAVYNSKIIYATKKYIYTHDIATNRITRLNGEYDDVRSISIIDENHVYITTWGSGIFLFDGKEIQKINLDLLNKIKFFYCSHVDQKGNLYLGTWDAGVIIYDGKLWKQISKKNGLSSNKISSITSDDNDFVYLGTNGSGVDVLNPNYSFKTNLNSSNYLSSNIINSLHYFNNILWIGGIETLTKYDLNTNSFYCYNRNQGFKASILLSSINNIKNSLYIGTTEGLWEVNETYALKNILNINPILDKIYVNKNLIKNKTSFSFSENNFKFIFHSPQQIGAEAINYNYILNGPDGVFSDETKNKSIQLIGLKHGNYELEIFSFLEKTKSKTPIRFSFSIKPPFWYSSWFAFLVVFLIFILGFTIYHFKTKSLQRKKQELENIVKERTKELANEKNLVEEKNKEILDSISYAKRIQSALLPQNKLIQTYLPSSFVIYLPKDIVAGDFYWFEPQGKIIIFAAADCTGHGVPGAMVSVICNNALNRATKEFKLSNPALILDKTREIVIEEFEKSNEDVKDGMDISICSLNIEKKILYWAGANNPLWIIRNNEILEWKADKQPIGKYENPKPFNSHKIELFEDDQIYLFTDGFQDQFGGPLKENGGKKFKASKMRQLFLEIEHQDIKIKKQLILDAFNNWKGNLEQVDDVCVIGVKV